MCDLVHYSISIVAGLAIAYLALLFTGTSSINDEAARITSISVSYSIAYLPYLLALWIATIVPETRRLRVVVVGGALLFRLLAFSLPPALSDDVLRYEWEASRLAIGENPYRVSPASVGAGNKRIPGYDFSAVYGPVLEVAHLASFRLGLPMKASAAFAEALLLGLFWWWMRKNGWPLWRWIVLGWSPLNVYEYWMNGHNDAWLILLLFAAFVTDGFWSWILLALATLTKWWPMLLIPLWLRLSFSWPGMIGYALLMASCLLWIPVGEWVTKVRFTTGFLGGWQNNAFLYRLLSDKMQAIALIVSLSAVLPFLKQGKAELIVWFLTFFLAISANIHPWYLGWLLPFLGASRVNPLPWLLAMALLPLAYDPMIGWRLNGEWREDTIIRNLIWGSVTVYSLFQVVRSRNR